VIGANFSSIVIRTFCITGSNLASVTVGNAWCV